MTRFIIPAILVCISVIAALTYTSPMYSNITALKAKIASYDEALNNSKALETERDNLTKKLNAINPDDIKKLQKLLPDNVDNIRLILEIEQLAVPYGMTLREVKYNATAASSTGGGAAPVGNPGASPVPGNAAMSGKDYGAWDLEFSTQGTYDNFLSFTRDMEHNLRIVDISSVDFSSDSVRSLGGVVSGPQQAYKYNFKIRTYWLKN